MRHAYGVQCGAAAPKSGLVYQTRRIASAPLRAQGARDPCTRAGFPAGCSNGNLQTRGAVKHPTRIGDIVSGNQILRPLLEQAAKLRRLDEAVKLWLGQPLARYATVAALHEETLVLLVASSAWAARVRYKVPELLAAAAAAPGLGTISRIQIKVGSHQHP